MTIAAIRQYMHDYYHASIRCAYRTGASDETLTVCTERMARAEGRMPCECWSPEGYIVIRDGIGDVIATPGVRETA